MNENLLQNEGMDTSNPLTDKIKDTIKNARLRLAENVASPTDETQGKTRKKRTQSTAGRQSSQEEIQRVNSELDKLFTGDNFRGLVRAPADLMLALTGNKIWDIPNDEIETLSTTGATCGRYFLSSDPKWLSLTLFSMAILTTYGTRAAIHLAKKDGKKE